jgi:hypothetical protein
MGGNMTTEDDAAMEAEIVASQESQVAEARRLLQSDVTDEALAKFQRQRGVLETWKALMNPRLEKHDHDGNLHHDHVQN